MRKGRFVAVMLGALAQPVFADIPVFPQVAGEIRQVEVVAGDTLVSLAGRLGLRWQTLAQLNGIEDPSRLRIGQVLRVDTRRIVPALLEDGLVINVPEATLYAFEGGKLTARYPVGLGRPGKQTPLGVFTVMAKESYSGAAVPAGFDRELSLEAEIVSGRENPGPQVGLGPFWVQLSTWGYGFYGTPHWAAVGRHLGYGCVRLGMADMEDLFRRVGNGMRTEVSYQPVKIALTPGDEVWVEAHPDVYGRGEGTVEDVVAALEDAGADLELVDRALLHRVLTNRTGLPELLGRKQKPNGGEPAPAAGVPADAVWRCLDCPPGPSRRVTLQLEARGEILLPNPFPIEILDDAGRPVYRAQMVAQAVVRLSAGQTRNFVWEVRDAEGQPLRPGSYAAVVRFFRDGEEEIRQLSVPLWVGN